MDNFEHKVAILEGTVLYIHPMEYRVGPPKPTSRPSKPNFAIDIPVVVGELDLVVAVLVIVHVVNELVADVELAEAAREFYPNRNFV